MSARLTVRQVDQVTVVDAAGKITLGEGARSMRDQIAELLKAGKSKILINLGEAHIDSAGIGELVDAFTAVKNRGGQLKLLTRPERAGGKSWSPGGGFERGPEMIYFFPLSEFFEVFDSEVTAIRSFGASSAVESK